MSSSSSQDGRREAASGNVPGFEVGVDGSLLEDLGTCYARYRQALAGPFDPVKTLSLTGEVLESVSTILIATGQYRTQGGPENDR